MEKILKWLLVGFVLSCELTAIEPPTHSLDAEIAPSLYKYLAEHEVSFSPELLASEDSGKFASNVSRRLRSDSRNADSLESKKALVDYVVYSLASKDAGVWQSAIEVLTSAHHDHFSDYSKQVLSDLNGSRMSNHIFRGGIAKVYGAAQIEYEWLYENVSRVDTDAEISRNSNPAAFSSLKALAKNGDPHAIRRLMEYARSLPEESWHSASPTIISHDLRYVAQPEIVDFLMELLLSDEIRNYEFDSGRIWEVPSASYPAEALSKMIEGFPYPPKHGAGFWSIEEIKNIREFMNSLSGEWPIIDYRDDLRKTEVAEQKMAEPEIAVSPVVAEVTEETIASEPQVNEPAEEAPEESTNWLLWLIGVLVVFVGLAVVVRRKN